MDEGIFALALAEGVNDTGSSSTVTASDKPMICIRCDSAMERGPVVFVKHYRSGSVSVNMPDGHFCPACNFKTFNGGKYMEDFVNQNMLGELAVLLREIELHCPCGARPESPNTHPHVIGCPVELALVLAGNLSAAYGIDRTAASPAP